MELQPALLLLGFLIIGAVALNAYDKLRLRRRVRQAKPLSTQALPDAAVSGLDINPRAPQDDGQRVLKAEAAAAARPTGDAVPETAGAASLDINPQALHGVYPDHRPLTPNKKIDFIVYLPGTQPVSRNQALGIYRQNEDRVDKPHRFYGKRHPGGLWSNLERDAEDTHYTELTLAMQLVDRNGPATETELNGLAQLALKLGDGLGRPTKFSGTFEQALVQAQDLERFCQGCDVLANIHVASTKKEGFNGRAIEQAATRLGMQFGAMNIFHMKNPQAAGSRHLFSLANLLKPGEFDLATLDKLKTAGLTLFMNVPCVDDPPTAFDTMTATARALCKLLEGRMLDPARRPLTDAGLAAIRVQIERIVKHMQQHGVTPGGAIALRLFHIQA